jgi:tRNA (mo5U34)-methyltransferase
MSTRFMHSFAFPDGTVHEGAVPVDMLNSNFAKFKLGDLTGKTVLDVGCSNGFQSIECAKRGAIVTSVDIDQYALDEIHKWVDKYSIPNIETKLLDVYDLDSLDQSYDIVLFLGLIYHLRHPLLGLEIVSRRAKNILIVETHASLSPDTVMEFYDADQINNDPSNWWGPSPSCLDKMMKTVGCKQTETLFYQRDFRRLAIKGHK